MQSESSGSDMTLATALRQWASCLPLIISEEGMYYLATFFLNFAFLS